MSLQIWKVHYIPVNVREFFNKVFFVEVGIVILIEIVFL